MIIISRQITILTTNNYNNGQTIIIMIISRQITILTNNNNNNGPSINNKDK